MDDRYNETSIGLFNDTRILPNHHYALHVPDQLRYWGPLMAVSEFSGEHINGLLQKAKTNNCTCKFIFSCPFGLIVDNLNLDNLR